MSNQLKSSEESQIRILLLGQTESGKEFVREAIQTQFDEGSERCPEPEWDLKTGTVMSGPVFLGKPVEVTILNYRCLHYSNKEKTLNVKKTIKEDMELIKPGPHVIIWVSKETNDKDFNKEYKLLGAFSEGFKTANRHILFVFLKDEKVKMSVDPAQKVAWEHKTCKELGETLLKDVAEKRDNGGHLHMDLLKYRLDDFINELGKNPGISMFNKLADECFSMVKKILLKE
ncbi:uncharacterized protein LOC106965225 [Poecilia latipinna]|uniref:uncharacterized protein LOC106908193 n=1 Tax=Poecilia mexicana TaxID=48701 RepID=UPI00072E0225|nr:PREDICTED: uncharacterized protein LOC106908193 [Poecilia mexicana]XP_014916674.1 PREDICTED: uncharacterized protein LOC106965225 [Poecilia latipinna]